MLRKSVIILLLLGLLVGCAVQATPAQVNGELLITEAAQTVEAMLTASAVSTAASATANPTMTFTATASPSPAATMTLIPAQPFAPENSAAIAPTSAGVVSSACDVAGFVADVTIPDNTEILGGNSFTKTWELRNDGTCTWNSSYTLVFYSGSLMSGPSSQQLTTGTVAPGGTIDISVDLTAPETVGTYIGYWVLRNASGANFGIGTNGSPFYVKIVVATAATYTPTATEESEATETPTATTESTATSAPTAAPSSTPAPSATPEPTRTPLPTETLASSGG